MVAYKVEYTNPLTGLAADSILIAEFEDALRWCREIGADPDRIEVVVIHMHYPEAQQK
jgi:hypothetical protein